MTAALLILIALFSWTPAYAQSGTGEIWGRVTGMTGEVVDRAIVTVTNAETGAHREMRTDNSGRFGFAALAAGHYQVTAVHDGFAGRRQDDIVLVPGQRMSIELPLRRALLPETIALNPHPPILESGRTHASAFVAEAEIEHLPIAGRRYLRLAELTPAVTQDAATGGGSVMALPSAQNRILIDGFDHTSSITGDPAGGEGPSRVPYQLSQWSVEGFRVETSGAPAENGRAGAAVINVITKSGANAFHGSGYEFFGDRALNGEKTLDQRAGLRKPPYRSSQFGGLVGGPILREHNFFLVSHDGLDRTAPQQRQDLLFARTDHEYAGQHLTLRYIDQQFDGQTAAGVDLSLLRNRSGASSLASTIGSAAINEARAQYSDSRDEENAASSLFGSHHFATTRLQVGDSLSWIAGGHSFKAGGDIVKDQNATRFGGPTFDTATVHPDVDAYAAFVQDAWRATRALTIDLGVRYDLQSFGSAISRERTDWAPRVGLAFAPGERKNVFRASYGLFYGTTPALIPALARAFNDVDVRVAPAPVAVIDPSFKSPRVHQASAGWEVEKYRAGSLGIDYLFARGERLPRPVEINIDGRFPGPNRVVSFQSSGQSLYNGITVHARARVLQQLFYTIAYTFSRSDDTPQEPIPMVFGGLNGRGSLAVQGHTLDTRAPGNNDQHHHLAISAMYDTSLLAVDRHGLSKRLIANWEYGLVYTLQSGQPYGAFVNGDINGDRNAFNDLAPDTMRNQYRLPFQISLDPRVARRFRLGRSRELSLMWEAFNVTNRPNYTAVDNTLYSVGAASLVRNPLFGRMTGQSDGRMMQVAAKLTF